MRYAGHHLCVPSQHSPDMNAGEMLHAIIGGEPLAFDLLDPEGVPVELDNVIYGRIVTFAVSEAKTEAALTVSFDQTTLPAGLKAGRHDLVWDKNGLCEVPESMLCDDWGDDDK